MTEGFCKGTEFEILWCKNKIDFYESMAHADDSKLKALQKDFEFASELLKK